MSDLMFTLLVLAIVFRADLALIIRAVADRIKNRGAK